LDAQLVAAAIKETMQKNVGMSRTDEGLAHAAAEMEALAVAAGDANEMPADLEVANLVTVGTLIAHAAWLRHESRGCHFRRDFPQRDDAWRIRIVQQRGGPPSRVAVEGDLMRWARTGGSLGDSAGSRVETAPPHETE
jgi:L-aspartate oxidase